MPQASYPILSARTTMTNLWPPSYMRTKQPRSAEQRWRRSKNTGLNTPATSRSGVRLGIRLTMVMRRDRKPCFIRRVTISAVERLSADTENDDIADDTQGPSKGGLDYPARPCISDNRIYWRPTQVLRADSVRTRSFGITAQRQNAIPRGNMLRSAVLSSAELP